MQQVNPMPHSAKALRMEETAVLQIDLSRLAETAPSHLWRVFFLSKTKCDKRGL